MLFNCVFWLWDRMAHIDDCCLENQNYWLKYLVNEYATDMQNLVNDFSHVTTGKWVLWRIPSVNM